LKQRTVGIFRTGLLKIRTVSVRKIQRATTTFETVIIVARYLAHDLHVGDGVRPLGTRDEQEGVAPARVELPQAGLGVSGLLLKRKSSGKGNVQKKGGNSH
jgi:hypothetical protein